MSRPLRVALSGIDGSGKSTSASAVSRRLAGEGYVVVHPLRRAYVDRPGREREHFGDRVHDLVDRAHRALDRAGSRAGVGLTNVLYARIWSAMQAWAIERYQPDIVLNGRSASLDPAVYSPFYFPFSRALPPASRIRLSRSIGGVPPSDLHFLLDVPADVAHARILARIDHERACGADDREKWTHMHETPAALADLRRRFARCVQAMPGPVVHLDAIQPQEEIVEEIVTAIHAASPLRRARA